MEQLKKKRAARGRQRINPQIVIRILDINSQYGGHITAKQIKEIIEREFQTTVGETTINSYRRNADSHQVATAPDETPLAGDTIVKEITEAVWAIITAVAKVSTLHRKLKQYITEI